jgi:SHS2 domain-containing protein
MRKAVREVPKGGSSVMPARWEHFHHQADVGVRGFGATPGEAFEQAALAMTAVITDPGKVEPRDRVEIACVEPDPELLLVDWLNAILYEMATRHFLFSRFEVRPGPGRLDAQVWGERVDLLRHRPAVEVKGATYTELRVAPDGGGGWIAQCVVDV